MEIMGRKTKNCSTTRTQTFRNANLTRVAMEVEDADRQIFRNHVEALPGLMGAPCHELFSAFLVHLGLKPLPVATEIQTGFKKKLRRWRRALEDPAGVATAPKPKKKKRKVSRKIRKPRRGARSSVSQTADNTTASSTQEGALLQSETLPLKGLSGENRGNSNSTSTSGISSSIPLFREMSGSGAGEVVLGGANELAKRQAARPDLFAADPDVPASPQTNGPIPDALINKAVPAGSEMAISVPAMSANTCLAPDAAQTYGGDPGAALLPVAWEVHDDLVVAPSLDGLFLFFKRSTIAPAVWREVLRGATGLREFVWGDTEVLALRLDGTKSPQRLRGKIFLLVCDAGDSNPDEK